MPHDVAAFYMIDHRLIALAMVALLLAACEIGYRLGLARVDAPDSLRALVSGTGAAILGLLGLLPALATLSVAFRAWSFGAASQRGRTPMALLALLVGAVLLLIMDVNRPQRGMIEVGVQPLERAADSIPAPTR